MSGKPTHDSRIVAQMVARGITKIVTLNSKDFQRYDFLTAMTPEEMLAK